MKCKNCRNIGILVDVSIGQEESIPWCLTKYDSPDLDIGRDCDFFESMTNADINTMFIKPDRTKDTRTPYEQYEAGEEIIYVDLSDINKDWKPEIMTRGEYSHRFLIPPAKSLNYCTKRNFKIDFKTILDDE